MPNPSSLVPAHDDLHASTGPSHDFCIKGVASTRRPAYQLGDPTSFISLPELLVLPPDMGTLALVVAHVIGAAASGTCILAPWTTTP